MDISQLLKCQTVTIYFVQSFRQYEVNLTDTVDLIAANHSTLHHITIHPLCSMQIHVTAFLRHNCSLLQESDECHSTFDLTKESSDFITSTVSRVGKKWVLLSISGRFYLPLSTDLQVSHLKIPSIRCSKA